MRRIPLGVTIAMTGLLTGWAGQSIWRDSPDELWAVVAVVSVLSGLAIALNPTVSRLLSPITGKGTNGR